MMRRAVMIIWLAVLSAAGAWGAEAALFNDGNRVVLRRWSEDDGPLLDIDLRTGTAKSFETSSIGAPAGFTPGGCSKSDFVLGTTGSLLLACDLAKKKTTTVYKAPKGVELEDLAYNPKDGAVLLLCSDNREDDLGSINITTMDASSRGYHSPLIYVPADASKAGPVFCRRVEEISGIAFAPDGTLYFTSKGDVWAGRIETGDPDSQMRFVLNAQRLAPTAVLETSEGTSASTAANEVAVGGKKLYVHSYRLRGSGMGDLYTIDRPVVEPETEAPRQPSPPAPEGLAGLFHITFSTDGPSTKEGPDPHDVDVYAKTASAVLGSLQVIQSYSRPPYLTSSPNGKFVLYGVGDDDNQTEMHVVDVEKNTSRTIAVKMD